MSSYTGVVKWFNSEKGYGFISANNGNDIFVHHSQLKENGPTNFYSSIYKKVSTLRYQHKTY